MQNEINNGDNCNVGYRHMGCKFIENSVKRNKLFPSLYLHSNIAME